GVIEEMGVVDQEKKAPAPGALDEGRRRSTQEVGPVVDPTTFSVMPGRENTGQRAEREAGRRSGGRDPDGEQPGRLGMVESLEGETCLADASRPGDHHAEDALRGDEAPKPVEFGGATDEWPVGLAVTPHA